ncbi:MAG: type II toxin-antitoxin system prevent-host-death family antitoxin [Neorhizobium sp.]|nr:type II toxin-antitoxin system prevent-host-death family antitoxin [Neorhizobium sp.]
MRISVSDASEHLNEMLARAEQGEEVFLTKNGLPSFQIVLVSRTAMPPDQRRKLLEKLLNKKATWSSEFNTDAAHSQDFLYDEFGLPR